MFFNPNAKGGALQANLQWTGILSGPCGVHGKGVKGRFCLHLMEGGIVLNKLQFTFLYLFQIYQQDIIARNFIDGYGKKQIYQAGARQWSLIMNISNPKV